MKNLKTRGKRLFGSRFTSILTPNPNVYHPSSVMPAVVSGHPVVEFETLDSRVHASVANRLNL
ncbi:MAG: hypothetical protein ACE1ZW_01500 [Nitrospirales bacterium]|nr:hypothetical protein [Nitrospirota bacterium]